MESNTSPSWEEPAPADVEAEVAVAAQDRAQLELPDVEHRRQTEQRLRNRQRLQLNAATMFHRRRQFLQGLEQTTTRNCLFTLFRTEDALSPHSSTAVRDAIYIKRTQPQILADR